MSTAAVQPDAAPWAPGLEALGDVGRLHAAYARVAQADGRQCSTTAFGELLDERLAELADTVLAGAYVLLTQEMAAACWRTGLDADLGMLHQPRSGRPSLALDLVEELRSVIVDSLVLSVFHRCVLRAEHLQHDPATGGIRLRDEGRRSFLREYELRMLTLFLHDSSGERVSYRRALVLQAEQFARVLRYPGVSYLPIRMT